MKEGSASKLNTRSLWYPVSNSRGWDGRGNLAEDTKLGRKVALKLLAASRCAKVPILICRF
ncbi:MAG: hypothetical protein AABN33_13680 [Acidobacteriota bacterium]